MQSPQKQRQKRLCFAGNKANNPNTMVVAIQEIIQLIHTIGGNKDLKYTPMSM